MTFNLKNFAKAELKGWKKAEIISLSLVFTFILINAYIVEDNIIAVKYTINKQDTTDMSVVSNIRWKLYDYFHNEIGDLFKKKPFRPGKYMTIGYVEYDENNYKEIFEMMKQLMKELPNGF